MYVIAFRTILSPSYVGQWWPVALVHTDEGAKAAEQFADLYRSQLIADRCEVVCIKWEWGQ